MAQRIKSCLIFCLDTKSNKKVKAVKNQLQFCALFLKQINSLRSDSICFFNEKVLELFHTDFLMPVLEYWLHAAFIVKGRGDEVPAIKYKKPLPNPTEGVWGWQNL